MSDVAPQRGKKLITNLLLAAALLSLVAAGCGFFAHTIEYRYGFTEGLVGGGNSGLFETALVLLAALCLWLFAVVTLLTAAALAFANAYRPSAAMVGLVLMVVAATPLGCCTGSRGVDRFAHGFRDGLRERDVDWDRIRAWRASISDAEKTWMTFDDDEAAALPNEIELLRPSWVSVRSDGTVICVFGGGFMHWGIDVYPLPHDSADNPPRTDYLEVAPGVFCWAGE